MIIAVALEDAHPCFQDDDVDERVVLQTFGMRTAEGRYHCLSDLPAVCVLTAGLKFKMQVVKAVVWGPLLLRPPFALFFLSATMTAFLLYNVWAGGNAPRTGKH